MGLRKAIGGAEFGLCFQPDAPPPACSNESKSGLLVLWPFLDKPFFIADFSTN
jgi:hypothetical protein